MGNRTTKSFANLRPQVLHDLVNATAFNAEEIRDLYRQFCHDCGQGKHELSWEDFEKMYKSLFPESDGTKFIAHVFRTYDKEGTGKINFRQFLTTLSVQLKGDSLQKLEWAFTLYDVHGSNCITWDDCVEIVKGLNSLGELEAQALPPEDVADYVFQKVNKGRQDRLDLHDFIEGASGSKTIQHLLRLTTRAASEPFVQRKLSTGSYGKPRRGSIPKLFEGDVPERARSNSAGQLESLPIKAKRKTSLIPNTTGKVSHASSRVRRSSEPPDAMFTVSHISIGDNIAL